MATAYLSTGNNSRNALLEVPDLRVGPLHLKQSLKKKACSKTPPNYLTLRSKISSEAEKHPIDVFNF